MDTRMIAGSVAILLAAATPAWAQFAPAAGGSGTGTPSISGAGTGLSAPSNIQSTGNGMTNPNAIPGMAAPAVSTVPSVYPGVGAGGAGLPPYAVPAHRAATHAATNPR